MENKNTEMKRGLVFSKYGQRAASTRQRIVQYAPYLREAGITLDLSPLLDDAYLAQLVDRGTRDVGRMARAYGKRMAMLSRAQDYDFIWVQYELFPYLPGSFEAMVRRARKPVICDYDDAIFHQYDNHPNPFLRGLLGGKLQPLLRRADLAFCGNRYLQEYVSRYCPRTELVPTVLDTSVYTPAPPRNTAIPTLGWIGSPTTWAHGSLLAPVLAEYVNAQQLNVLVVGAGHAATDHPFTFRDWDEAREVVDIHSMDIGIMPLPDEPWARGKCGYKLIQYMACGLPVIASPVGVNCEIVEHGVNGFLASTDAEWRAAIDQLRADPALRTRMGAAGRATIEARYAISTHGPRVAGLIRQLVDGGK